MPCSASFHYWPELIFSMVFIAKQEMALEGFCCFIKYYMFWNATALIFVMGKQFFVKRKQINYNMPLNSC